jgi:predicted transposase YdaD
MAYVSRDKEALRAYQMREMALSDWTSGINYAREEGIREGKREGILEGKREGILEGKREGMLEGKREGKQEGILEGRMERDREIAWRMKKQGVSIDQIAGYTGLSLEEIAGL